MEPDVKAEGRPGRKFLFLKLFAVAAAILLILLAAKPWLTNRATYETQTRYLDAKMENANMLALGSSSASFVVSMLPEDTGTAISNELARFSGYLLLVISAIFLEKYMLVAIGWISVVLALVSCVFMFIAILTNSANKAKWKEYAVRILIFSLCVACVIPLGCYCGQAIEDMNRDSIRNALEAAEGANEIVESIPVENDNSFFRKVGDFFSGLWDSAKQAYDWAKGVLNSFMAAVAVMLVTTVVIPILLILASVLAIRFLTRHDFVVALIEFADSLAGKAGKWLTGRK